MATIQITGIDSKDHLIMDNKGNASVDKGKHVKWKVKDSSITKITITPKIKSGQTNIWKTLPAPYPKSDSLDWRGTIGDKKGVSEDYNITFETNDGKTGKHDPRITVNK